LAYLWGLSGSDCERRTNRSRFNGTWLSIAIREKVFSVDLTTSLLKFCYCDYLVEVVGAFVPSFLSHARRLEMNEDNPVLFLSF